MVLVLSTVLLSCWTILTMQLKSSARTTRKPFPSVQQFQGGFVVWGLWSELHHIEFLHLNKEWPFLSPRHIRWSKQICSAGVSILTGKGKDVTGKKTKSTKMLNFQVSYSLSVRSCIPNWRSALPNLEKFQSSADYRAPVNSFHVLKRCYQPLGIHKKHFSLVPWPAEKYEANLKCVTNYKVFSWWSQRRHWEEHPKWPRRNCIFQDSILCSSASRWHTQA